MIRLKFEELFEEEHINHVLKSYHRSRIVWKGEWELPNAWSHKRFEFMKMSYKNTYSTFQTTAMHASRKFRKTQLSI